MSNIWFGRTNKGKKTNDRSCSTKECLPGSTDIWYLTKELYSKPRNDQLDVDAVYQTVHWLAQMLAD